MGRRLRTQCTHLLPGTNTKLASRYAFSALPSRPALTSVPQAIDALEECHVEHNVAKFWGVCNGFKDALDECLKQEKKPIRKKALEEAREARKKWEEAKSVRK